MCRSRSAARFPARSWNDGVPSSGNRGGEFRQEIATTAGHSGILPGSGVFLGTRRLAQKSDVVAENLLGYLFAMSTVIDESFAGVWERIIQPGRTDLPPDAARYFLNLQFADADRARMNELAAKASAGTLDPEEDTELANYMQLGWFLDLVRSKARRSLRPLPSTSG